MNPTRYKAQAQRVYNHVKEKLALPDHILQQRFKISVPVIAATIAKSVPLTKLNGKQVADKMILLFDTDHQRINHLTE